MMQFVRSVMTEFLSSLRLDLKTGVTGLVVGVAFCEARGRRFNSSSFQKLYSLLSFKKVGNKL